MKNPSFRPLSILLSVVLPLLVGATAHAQTVIDHLPYTISTGGLYVLNSNLTTTRTSGNLITVSASNVTIDFQGHYIAGPAGNTSQTTVGVQAYERSNLTIKNGTIAYCFMGTEIQGNGAADTNNVNTQIDNLRTTNCYAYGIYVSSSVASRITNCQVSHIGYNGAGFAYGIVAGGSVTVQNNLVSNVVGGSEPAGIFAFGNTFVCQNKVTGAYFGVYGGLYQDNLTSGCTQAMAGGTDAGGNGYN